MNELVHNEKIRLINELMDFLQSSSYDAEIFAKYVYVKSLDKKSYFYRDKQLNNLLDILGGMSAGEEFYYSKDEALEMLTSYVIALKKIDSHL